MLKSLEEEAEGNNDYVQNADYSDYSAWSHPAEVQPVRYSDYQDQIYF